jgi:hypothetical protein
MTSTSVPVVLPSFSLKASEVWSTVSRQAEPWADPRLYPPSVSRSMSTTLIDRDAELQLSRIDRVLARYTLPELSSAEFAFIDLPDGPAIQFGSDAEEVPGEIIDDTDQWSFAVYPDEVWR